VAGSRPIRVIFVGEKLEHQKAVASSSLIVQRIFSSDFTRIGSDHATECNSHNSHAKG